MPFFTGAVAMLGYQQFLIINEIEMMSQVIRQSLPEYMALLPSTLR